MTDRCSACGRQVESRTRGAARILAALDAVEEDIVPVKLHTPVVTLAQVRELRVIAREMLCICEQSVALAEAAS